MSEQKRKIGFTVACINEFANRHRLSSKEAFQYLFQFKGIAFIKENYDVEHTLDFETVLEDLRILCKKKWGYIMRLYHGSNIVIENVLCMMPQNNWLATDAPLSWGIYRNIPFALIGLIIIVLFYKSAKEKNDKSFRWMWLTILKHVPMYGQW